MGGGGRVGGGGGGPEHKSEKGRGRWNKVMDGVLGEVRGYPEPSRRRRASGKATEAKEGKNNYRTLHFFVRRIFSGKREGSSGKS